MHYDSIVQNPRPEGYYDLSVREFRGFAQFFDTDKLANFEINKK